MDSNVIIMDPEWIKEQRELGWPDMHPEDFCHKCGIKNLHAWSASKEDWDVATAKWQEETGREGICCPQCFAEMYEEATGEKAVWVLLTWTGNWEDYTIGYDRRVLVDILVYHYRNDNSSCGCGWAKLGYSHPEHIAEVYEASMAARNGTSIGE